MRASATLAVLLFLSCCVLALGENWKTRKLEHIRVNPLDGESIDYFANGLKNEKDFKKHLRKILIPRVPGTQGSETVRNYLSSTMESLGWDVEIVSSVQQTPRGPLPFHNVVATLDPSAPRRLVLACHYDSLSKPKGFLGATDSAVPCAMMINLAYTMRRDLQEDKRNFPELTLQLIFFDGEEALKRWEGDDNTYGARDLAKKWEKTPYQSNGIAGDHNDRIDLFVLLDLIGAKDPSFLALQRSTAHWFQRLVRIERQLQSSGSLRRRGRPMFTDTQSRTAFGAAVEDDHIPFMRRGVPILHLICVPFPSVWHKASDNESAVDYKTVADLNKILRVFVAEYMQIEQQ